MAKKNTTDKKVKAKKNNEVTHEEEQENVKKEKVTSDESKEETEKEEDSVENQLSEMKDRYLRLSAEFDNYRKRTLKEKMDLTKTASEDIIRKLLPVVDDFERGLMSMETAKDINAVKEGVKLIYNKIGDILKQQGVKEVEALDMEFDMDRHEAITKIPAPKEELKGKVVDVVEKGYYLHEKIIRYPKVVVGE